MGGDRKSAVVEEEREGAGITIDVLQQHFHQPLVTVAEELGVSLTVSHASFKILSLLVLQYSSIRLA